MTTQNVTYLIDAQDKASAKFKSHQSVIKSLARETKRSQQGLANSAQSVISSTRTELEAIRDKIETVRAYGQTSSSAANESREALKRLIQQHKDEAARIKEKNSLLDQTKSKTGQVASLTGALGSGLGGAFGGAASEASGLIGQIDGIKESLDEGGKAAMFLKAGLVTAVAVGAFKLGQAIGDVVLQTAKWRRANAAALKEMAEDTNRLTSAIDRAHASRLAFAEATTDPGQRDSKLAEMFERAKVEADGAARNVERLKASVAAMEDSYDIRISQESVDTEKALLEAAKATLAARRNQRQQLEDLISPAAKALKLAQEQFQAREASTSQIDSLNKQLQLAKSTGEDRLRLELKFAGVLDGQLESAVKMRQEIDAIAAAEKAKERATADAASKEKKRLADIAKAAADAAAKAKKAAADRAREEQKHAQFQKKTIDGLKEQLLEYTRGKDAAMAFRLEQGGFAKEEAKSVARLSETIQRLQKAKAASSNAGANTAKDERLVSGRAAASFRKTAAVIEAQRQTKIQKAMQASMDRLVQLQESIEKIEVVQHGG